jgi:hypothetical protein
MEKVRRAEKLDLVASRTHMQALSATQRRGSVTEKMVFHRT